MQVWPREEHLQREYWVIYSDKNPYVCDGCGEKFTKRDECVIIYYESDSTEMNPPAIYSFHGARCESKLGEVSVFCQCELHNYLYKECFFFRAHNKMSKNANKRQT